MSEMLIQQEAAQSARQARTAPQGKVNWRTQLTGWGFVLPFLIGYAIFTLWPVILGFRMSFYNWSLNGVTRFLGLGNYQELLSDADFWNSLWHTIYFTILSTPILVILAFFLALLANRQMPGRWIFRTAFFIPVALPIAVTAIIWNWLYQPGFGLINNMLAGIGLGPVDWLNDAHVAMISIVIMTVWWTVGSNFLLYLAGLQQVPAELYEAAAIDGAGSWAKTISITLPQLSRITMLVVILQVIASLQVFGQMYLLTGGGPNFATRSVVEYMYETGFSSFRMGFASAASYILFILMLVITVMQFVFFQRPQRRA
ncbi:sugar ABC transporter permease [Dictyobacter sp. S3.2.2.5]|uniref:Sugar ABC transporter permease n=1 Tax=Dictyobacter halimunensis TaxID=3026934 RepID=A0ABQ6FMW1_9CHLR|nr:sugar ABC transporter permease [Dictyobacter sp. S3.2.2.5]